MMINTGARAPDYADDEQQLALNQRLGLAAGGGIGTALAAAGDSAAGTSDTPFAGGAEMAKAPLGAGLAGGMGGAVGLGSGMAAPGTAVSGVGMGTGAALGAGIPGAPVGVPGMGGAAGLRGAIGAGIGAAGGLAGGISGMSSDGTTGYNNHAKGPGLLERLLLSRMRFGRR